MRNYKNHLKNKQTNGETGSNVSEGNLELLTLFSAS